MNKNKIIFGILWGIIVLLLLVGVMYMNASTKTTNTGTKVNGPISIWIIGDSKDVFQQIVSDFKAQNKEFWSANVNIESFSNLEEYNLALSSSFIKGKSPDIFVLNSNESSQFEDQITGLSPTIFNPQDFRKNFKEFFGEALIKSTPNPTGDKSAAPVEFVVWVPVWYETLGIFFNRRFFQAKDMTSWSNISEAARLISEKNSTMIPIALWNGSVTPYASDIISQFFLLDGFSSLEAVEWKKMKESLATYLSYGDANGDNKFNTRTTELINSGKNALHMFSRDDTAAVVGYPRMINEIEALWFKKTFLLAAPFPHYSLTDGKTLVNYNYFVINKNTKNYAFSEKFLTYLASESWAKKYLSVYPYYLPAMINLEAELFSQKIHPSFNIVLKDFYSDTTFWTFNKSVWYLYDTEMIKVLDDSVNAISRFETVKKILLCKSKKILNLSNLSIKCEE
jgi:ABC-type glycerol-3-phosphate transport system substrate-binding protein